MESLPAVVVKLDLLGKVLGNDFAYVRRDFRLELILVGELVELSGLVDLDRSGKVPRNEPLQNLEGLAPVLENADDREVLVDVLKREVILILLSLIFRPQSEFIQPVAPQTGIFLAFRVISSRCTSF